MTENLGRTFESILRKCAPAVIPSVSRLPRRSFTRRLGGIPLRYLKRNFPGILRLRFDSAQDDRSLRARKVNKIGNPG